MSDKKKALENYATVRERVQKFREEHGITLGMETELLDHEPGISCTMKATIKDSHGFVIATGHSHEKVSDNVNVNVQSLMENCETSAWGRCLANFGYSIEKSIASREEVKHLEPQQYTGTAKQKATLSRCLRTARVTDKQLAKTVHEDAITQEIKDDELTLSNFIKEYTA